MKKQPVISVIIPCYNSENYIERTINSVLTCKSSDIEIIVVDDCSTDNSYYICSIMAKNNSNITLLKNEINKGRIYSRNVGIDNATGKWIIFLDSDDTLDTTTLIQQMDLLNNDIDIYYYDFKYIYKHKEKCIKNNANGVYCKRDFVSLLNKEIPWESISCIGNKIYNRNLIINSKLRFDNKYGHCEDSAFSLLAIKYSKNISVISCLLYKYYQNTSSVLHKYLSNFDIYLFNTLTLFKNMYLDVFELNNVLENFNYCSRYVKTAYTILRNESLLDYRNYFNKYNEIRKTELLMACNVVKKNSYAFSIASIQSTLLILDCRLIIYLLCIIRNFKNNVSSF